MFEHYPVTGDIQQISVEQAQKLMDSISDQWEDEQTSFGKLYMGVFDWDYKNTPTRMEILIPNLRGGGQIPLNKTATDKFGFEIYGDCFLKI